MRAKKCIYCGKPIFDVTEPCRYCGKMQTHGSDTKTDRCPKCGAPLRQGTRYCPVCGFDITYTGEPEKRRVWPVVLICTALAAAAGVGCYMGAGALGIIGPKDDASESALESFAYMDDEDIGGDVSGDESIAAGDSETAGYETGAVVGTAETEAPLAAETETVEETEAPLTVETEIVEEPGYSFVFPNMDSAYLTYDDLRNCDYRTLRLAVNEVYARHGYIFHSTKHPEVGEYFEAQEWYQNLNKVSKDQEVISQSFNSYEKENVKLIREYIKEYMSEEDAAYSR